MTYNLLDLYAFAQNGNVKAFSQMLRHGEGTLGYKGYSTLFGGKLFQGFDDHPRLKVTAGSAGKQYTSTAAGAYQFLSGTWDDLTKAYGQTDFSPNAQDAKVVGLYIRRNALNSILAGQIEEAVRLCCKEWASLPESPYGQPTVTMEKALEWYREAGGILHAVHEEPSAPETLLNFLEAGPVRIPLSPSIPQSELKESSMLPFLAAAASAVFEAAPQLIKLFGGGSDIAERNAKAAQTVVEIAKAATGATNEQDLVERIATDPKAAVAIQEAVQAQWFSLSTNMADVEKAREANLSVGAPNFWLQPAFWITLLLTPLLYMTVYKTLWDSHFSSEVQSMVISGIITGILGGLMGFWFGTSFSSSRKTELSAQGNSPKV